MQVIRVGTDKEWHLVAHTRWGEDEFKAQLKMFFVQFFCQDRAWPYPRYRKFILATYNRADHGSKICEGCKLKVEKSKKYGKDI